MEKKTTTTNSYDKGGDSITTTTTTVLPNGNDSVVIHVWQPTWKWIDESRVQRTKTSSVLTLDPPSLIHPWIRSQWVTTAAAQTYYELHMYIEVPSLDAVVDHVNTFISDMVVPFGAYELVPEVGPRIVHMYRCAVQLHVPPSHNQVVLLGAMVSPSVYQTFITSLTTSLLEKRQPRC